MKPIEFFRTVLGLVILLLTMQHLRSQSIIAKQQFKVADTCFLLTTYEKTSSGFKQVLTPESGAKPAVTDTFCLLDLDAKDFSDRLSIAIKSRIDSANFDANDYAEIMKLFGGIVLAANATDTRPVAGRLILNKSVQIWRAAEDGDNSKTLQPHKKAKNAMDAMKMRLSNEDKPESKLSSQEIQLIADYETSIKSIGADLDSLSRTWNFTNDQNQKYLRGVQQYQEVAQKEIVDLTNALAELSKNSITYQNHGVVPETKGNDIKYFDSSPKELDSAWNQLNQIEPRINSDFEAINEKLISAKEKVANLQKQINQNAPKSSLSSTSITAIIDSVRVEFNEGMIERIMVVATCHETKCTTDRCQKCESLPKPLIFTNHFPIGFSTPRNYANFHPTQQCLLDRTGTYAIALWEVFTYIPNLELNTRDLSPRDTAMTFFPETKEYVLHKAPTSELLKARIYTDFVGLNESEPNGLIQTEIEKRINLYTYRLRIGTGRFFNGSFFQFVTPSFTLSKIDSKLRRLEVESKTLSHRASRHEYKYATTLNLLQYENMSAGLDLNLFMLDAPQLKATMFLNAGARTGRVALADSVANPSDSSFQRTGAINMFGVNTVRPFVELKVMVYPEQSFNFWASYRPTYVRLLSDQLHQVENVDAIGSHFGVLKLEHRIVHTFELGTTIKLSPRGELYGRYRLHMLNSDLKTNFHQAQVGYSMYLTKKLSGK